MVTKLTVTTLLVSLLVFTSFVESYRILLVFPWFARSHFILGNALAKGLAEAGHHATIISSYQDKNPIIKNKNGTYEEIYLDGLVEEKEEHVVNLFERGNNWPVLQVPAIAFMTTFVTNQTLNHPNFKKLLTSKDHYDAVIVEQFFADALKILAHHFKAPQILFSPIGTNTWVNELVGNPEPLAYISDTFLGYSPPFSFSERVNNVLVRIVSDSIRYLYSYPTHEKMMKKSYPNAPDLEEILYNVSLVLVNAHESANEPVPHVANMIDIGGYHVEEPKPLPKDLQDFMDNAKEGVIYFSMGSNLVPSAMPAKTLDILLKALGQVKQKVLWKWNEENLPNKPDNVKISKWFPQRDILAHPNCILFITHGGLLSTTETVSSGVPVLAFPVYGDQKLNSGRAQAAGYGISLPFADITEEKLSRDLKELIENPKYRENAKKRSAIMHDRIVKPMDTAVYWVEYVIRHKGAPHLKVAAVDLPLYQYLLLDVVGFLILVSLGSILILYLIIKKLFCKSKVPSYVKVKTN